MTNFVVYFATNLMTDFVTDFVTIFVTDFVKDLLPFILFYRFCKYKWTDVVKDLFKPFLAISGHFKPFQ